MNDSLLQIRDFYSSTTKKGKFFFFPLYHKMMPILSLTFTSVGMMKESLSLTKMGLVPIRSCSRLLSSWRNVEASTLGPSPRKMLSTETTGHCHILSLHYTTLPDKEQKQSWLTGKRVCARKGKKIRCIIPSSLPLQREIMTWSRKQ